jgi:hypothetical protein
MGASIYHHLAAVQAIIIQAVADRDMNISDLANWMHVRAAVLGYLRSDGSGGTLRQEYLDEAAELLPDP